MYNNKKKSFFLLSYIINMNSNIKNDNCFKKEQLYQSKNMSNYMLYPGKYYNNKNCRMELGIVGGNNVSLYAGNLVNLESELRGQTKRLTACSCNKYKKSQKKLVNLPSCQLQRINPVYVGKKLKVTGCSYSKKKGWF